ncbi:complement component C7 [Gastrophryne carolinensis]
MRNFLTTLIVYAQKIKGIAICVSYKLDFNLTSLWTVTYISGKVCNLLDLCDIEPWTALHAQQELLLLIAVLLPVTISVPWNLFWGSRVSPVNCKWGSFGPWSECDPCTKTQSRKRGIEDFAQFGGAECYGDQFQTQACVPSTGCPLEEGCGDRFRCASGQCISQSLVCNGDHDCERDSSDEHNCDRKEYTCDTQKYAPNTELTGAGFDAVTGQRKTSNVIHTNSYGGRCWKVYSAENRDYYRLSNNVLTYTFKVSAKNDFTYDFYNSSWARQTSHHYKVDSNYGEKADIPKQTSEERYKSYQYLVIRNTVEVAQFINKNAEQLNLAEPFWKELVHLPSVYEYSSYRRLIDKYGTHFLQSGSMGGEYEFRFFLETDIMKNNGVEQSDVTKCTSTSIDLLIVRFSQSECRRTFESIKSSSGNSNTEIRGQALLKGGNTKFQTRLSIFSLQNPSSNLESYTLWAGSVSDLPTVIKYKLTPLYELIKEVPCASVKKIFLKRAIEEYINEEHSCHCKPCRNNGLPAIRDRKCVCYCKPHTYGDGCEDGKLADESPGVVDGSWSCWSSWSTCYGTAGRRSRSRYCNNPTPSGGGKYCIGDGLQSEKCEEDELEHLRTVPALRHCFITDILPTKFCPSPPALKNGDIMKEDKDTSYHVGKRIVYKCDPGYTLVGEAVAECKSDLTWQWGNVKCVDLLCPAPRTPDGMIITPQKKLYEIGEKLKLSCHPDYDLEGDDVSLCSSSLTWNPNPKEIKCIKKATPKEEIKCQPWEKLQKLQDGDESECTCKMPAECGQHLMAEINELEKGQFENLPETSNSSVLLHSTTTPNIKIFILTAAAPPAPKSTQKEVSPTL